MALKNALCVISKVIDDPDVRGCHEHLFGVIYA